LLTRTLESFAAEGMMRAALDVDAPNPSGTLKLYEKLEFEAIERTIHFAKRLNQCIARGSAGSHAKS
jgi:hypothetical protein